MNDEVQSGLEGVVAFASAIVATSWPASWAMLAVCQLAGVAVLAPLVAEERGRREVRRAHQRAQHERRTCNASRVTVTTRRAT